MTTRLFATIFLLATTQLFAATYNIGPGQVYANIGDAPWSTLNGGDTVNIYAKADIVLATASASTGTTLTLAAPAFSIPYGSTVWFAGYAAGNPDLLLYNSMAGYSAQLPYVTCGVYGSGLYGSETGGTPCAGNTVTISSPLNVPAGAALYFQPPYFEKAIIAPASFGTASAPITIQGIPDPVTGALPVLDADLATTGPNMEHYGNDSSHDNLGLMDLLRNTAETVWPRYIIVRHLRLQNAQPGVSYYDGSGALAAYGAGVAGLRFETAENATIKFNEFVNDDDGEFGATNGPNTCNYCLFQTNMDIYGNHFWQNGDNMSCHQSYLEADFATYEYNWFDVGGRAGEDQLKDRSTGAVVRYNLFYPNGHVLDLVDAQNSFSTLVPQTNLSACLPSGGFAAGATLLTFTCSVAGVSVGDYVGYRDNNGWYYPGAGSNVMPTVTSVNTATNTLTLSAGIPTAVPFPFPSASDMLTVVSAAITPYKQTFVYGNLFRMSQLLYPHQPGSAVHYGWDTAGGIDSVADRAGTLYFYDNTLIFQWDLKGSTGSSYGNPVFVAESNNDKIEWDDNLFAITNANAGKPSSFLNVVYHGEYANGGAQTISGQYGGGANQATKGWRAQSVNNYPLVPGALINTSGWTSELNAAMFPGTFPSPVPFALPFGSTAIGAATPLPLAVFSNTFGENFMPVSEFGATPRNGDLGAIGYAP